MNYANLIEDAKLKKTFIVATLVSTVIGTFQAASTLHDKLEEKRERKAKQSELDSKQNKALKELQEKLKLLESGEENKDGGDKDEKKEGDGKNEKGGRDDNNNDKRSNRSAPRSRSRSRSRSRDRRRRREEWEDNMYFAESARRSQAMIERTYNDHLQRLGPAYAQGDMITENALQAQTIRLQQTVIGILQEAANTGRGLTRDDLDRLIAAQESARDGSLRALNGQYDRIAYRQPMSGMIRERPIEVATYQHEPAQLTIEPASYAPRQSPPVMTREASSRPQVEETSHRSAIVPPPPPPTVQREFARLALGPPPRSGSQRGSRRSSPHRAATAAATIDAKVTPPEVDRVSEHQERRSRAGSPPSRRKSTSLVTHAPKAPASERKASSLVHSAPSLMDKSAGSTTGKTNATQVDGKTAASVSGKNNATQDDKKRAASTSGKTNATQVDGKTAAPASGRDYDAQADRNRAASTSGRTNATQVDGRTAASRNRSPSRSRRDSVVPPAAQNSAPVKRSASIVAQAPKTAPSTTSHKPKEETAPAPSAPKSTVQKALDTTPYELFCKYSLDLQYSRSKPLSSSFRPSADHRCPSCQIRIPVDTRDVWVLSTHFPGKENRHRVREYRMDSRFVVKCHRPEGGFACVLCDRFRDMDCLCKSVEALVKHLGTAHTPDEFERDPDLVRIKEGSGVGVNSREMVYV